MRTVDRPRGLVRAVDRDARRHRYGVGGPPPGEVTGELGALAPGDGADREPVWLTAEAEVVTGAPAAWRRPSPGAVARWMREPLGWSGDPPAVRARALVRRAHLSALSLGSKPEGDSRPSGEPVGWLVPEGPGTLALYEARHPITGDQLLSTEPGEAARLGYGQALVLGHVLGAAPVTGVLGVPEVDLAWAARAAGDRHRPLGRGAIERPAEGEEVSREAFLVGGVALFPPGPVARVEVRVDGRLAGNARLGLPRLDLAVLREHLHVPEAPVCGFELVVTAAGVDPGATEAVVEAEAVNIDGRRFPLPPRAVALAPPGDPPHDPGGRVAGLRERTQRLVAEASPPPHEGLKVLVFAHRLDLGGAQRYLFELLRRLAEDPAFGGVVATPTGGPYTAAIEALGLPVHVLPSLGPGDPEAYEGGMLELAAWAAPQGFDLVWANTFDAYPGSDLATRLGIPAVWSLHESFEVAQWWAAVYGREDAYPYARERAEEALGRADALVFAADATRRQYAPHAPAERMHTLPYGMELDAIAGYRRRHEPQAARASLGIDPGTVVALCLGTFEPRKGQATAAQAFAAVAEEHPEALLVLVGDQAGLYSEGLHQLITRLGLEGRVRIEPLAAEPYAWHAVADLFVLASDIESSPIVVLEAMAFGTPVVATGVFGVPELIEDGVNGYLCEPNDVSSLAAALNRALGDDERARQAVGEAGALRVAERHDPERYARDMRSLMAGLATGASGPVRAAPVTFSVLIPTLNAGERFARTLEVLQAQEGLDGLELLVADSGSDDGTPERAERAGAQVEAVDPEDFNHGAVRNRLVERSTGELLVFMVQDAVLTEPTALAELGRALDEDPLLAAVSGTPTARPGADLFSSWLAWFGREWSGEPRAMDNVCAVVRPSAWEELRFGELAFGEDLDFDLRARARGWRTAYSPRPLVAHYHDRPADHFFARAAIHRLQRGRLADLERHPVAAPGLDPLTAALPQVLGELQAALSRAVPPETPMTLARCLRRIAEALRGVPEPLPPELELRRIADLCPPGGPLDGALPALRDELAASLEFTWLLQFALSRTEPVAQFAAHAFVSRFVGSALGEVVGDAMRDGADPEFERRMWAAALWQADAREHR